jgi:hypothetical protein
MRQLRGKLAAMGRLAKTWDWTAASRMAARLILCGISGAAGLAYVLSGAGPAVAVVVLGLVLAIGLLVSGRALAAASEAEARQPGPHQLDARVRAAGADLGGYVHAYTGTWLLDREWSSEEPKAFAVLVPAATPLAGFLACDRRLAWLALVALVAGPAAFAGGCRELAKVRVHRIYRFEDGFVCRGLHQAHAFRWADVAELRTVAVPVVR